MGKGKKNAARSDRQEQLPQRNNNRGDGSTMAASDSAQPGCLGILGAVLSRRPSHKQRSPSHDVAAMCEAEPFVDGGSSVRRDKDHLDSNAHNGIIRGLPEGTDEASSIDEAAVYTSANRSLLDRATSTSLVASSSRGSLASLREQSTSMRSLQSLLLNDKRKYTECASSACQLDMLKGGEPLLYTQSDLDAVMKARDQDREKKITELQAKLKNERADHTAKQDSLKKEINEMKTIVGEYEKTIIELTENSQRNTMIKDGTLSDLIKEKEQLRSDLNTAESGIIEAYKRVETLKRAVEDYRSNETQLKQCIEDFKEKLRRSEERYQTLKKHAEEKLDFANREIGKVRKAKEVDMAGLEATVKKCQAKASTLEQSLNQKISENEELTKICDDLINRVSGKAD